MQCVKLSFHLTGVSKRSQRKIVLRYGRKAGMPKMRRRGRGRVKKCLQNLLSKMNALPPTFFFSYARRIGATTYDTHTNTRIIQLQKANL